ncbi:hypothetical protein LXA43DRAFT_901641 [Ganoderma leucocontextum]|nr:hypothetical protein LXA43DRAFT_901641 [Ganoderma leucocontextum]
MQHQTFYTHGGSSFSSMNFDVSGGLSLPAFSSQVSLASQGGGLQGADLNSPEVFKQNIQIAQAHVARVQELAGSALAGIEHAYHQGASPLQTAADVAAVKQAVLALVEHLRQSGVGALPLEAPPVPDLRSDEQMIGEATRTVQVLYERQKRIQDGAGVVAGLLGQGFGAGPQGAGEQLSQGSVARRVGQA